MGVLAQMHCVNSDPYLLTPPYVHMHWVLLISAPFLKINLSYDHLIFFPH